MSKVEQFSPYKRKQYSRSEQTQIRKEFRRQHGCCNCLNEWDFDSCMENGICQYDPKPELFFYSLSWINRQKFKKIPKNL